MASNMRQRILSGETLIGPFAAIPHPVAIEVTAAAGPDFLCIDAEHAQIGRERLEDLIRAGDVHGVPRVSTVAEAQAAVTATRYPPQGARGVGPGRAAAYGYRIPDYLESANRTVLLAIQVETAAGLANISQIAAVEGIDVIFIGPGDLSVSIGALGPEGRELLQAAIVTIASAATDAGRIAGIFRPAPDDIAAWRGKGISFFILASDTMFLGASVAAGLATARAATGDKPA